MLLEIGVMSELQLKMLNVLKLKRIVKDTQMHMQLTQTCIHTHTDICTHIPFPYLLHQTVNRIRANENKVSKVVYDMR